MKNAKQSGPVSHGVDALIAQLRAEGVEAGRKEAETLLVAARAEAADIVRRAEEEAEAVRQSADIEAKRLHRNGQELLQKAARDAVLQLRGELLERFSADLRRMVSEAMADPALVRQLIIEVAGKAGTAAGVQPGDSVEALLPERVAQAFDLRQDLDGLRHAPLTQLVLGGTRRILAEGVSLGVQPHVGDGLVLRVRDGELEIDLSDEAVAGVLLSHLEPRFRALFDGIIR